MKKTKKDIASGNPLYTCSVNRYNSRILQLHTETGQCINAMPCTNSNLILFYFIAVAAMHDIFICPEYLNKNCLKEEIPLRKHFNKHLEKNNNNSLKKSNQQYLIRQVRG